MFVSRRRKQREASRPTVSYRRPACFLRRVGARPVIRPISTIVPPSAAGDRPTWIPTARSASIFSPPVTRASLTGWRQPVRSSVRWCADACTGPGSDLNRHPYFPSVFLAEIWLNRCGHCPTGISSLAANPGIRLNCAWLDVIYHIPYETEPAGPRRNRGCRGGRIRRRMPNKRLTRRRPCPLLLYPSIPPPTACR